MTWADVGILTASGFQQQGYLLLIFYIYPVLKLLKNKDMNKLAGLISGALGVVLSVYYLTTKRIDLFGTAVNAAGTGLYVFILATVGLCVGVFKYSKVEEVELDVVIEEVEIVEENKIDL